MQVHSSKMASRDGPKATPAATSRVSQSDSSDAESVDDNIRAKPRSPRLNRKQKITRHFSKNWKWYLLGLIVFLAILLPILYVCMANLPVSWALSLT